MESDSKLNHDSEHSESNDVRVVLDDNVSLSATESKNKKETPAAVAEDEEENTRASDREEKHKKKRKKSKDRERDGKRDRDSSKDRKSRDKKDSNGEEEGSKKRRHRDTKREADGGADGEAAVDDAHKDRKGDTSAGNIEENGEHRKRRREDSSSRPRADGHDRRDRRRGDSQDSRGAHRRRHHSSSRDRGGGEGSHYYRHRYDRDRHYDRGYRGERDHHHRYRSRDRGDRDRDSRERRRRRSPSSSPERNGRGSSSSRRRDKEQGDGGGASSSSGRNGDSVDAGGGEGSGGGDAYKPITLKEIITANPGISVPEAVARMNAHNTAAAKGINPAAPPLPPQQQQQLAMGGGILAGNPAPPPPPLPTAPMPAEAAAQRAANAIAAVNSAHLSSLVNQGEGGIATKPHRELYIGNLPPGITVPQLAEFLNATFKQLGLTKNPELNTVLNAWVSPDGHYSFVEVRSQEEATAAITYLNGIQVGVHGLKIGRPKGYNPGGPVAPPNLLGMTPAPIAAPSVALVPNALGPTTLPPLGGQGAAATVMSVTTTIPGQPPITNFGGIPSAGAAGIGLAGLSGGGLGGAALMDAIMVTNLPSLVTEDQIKELFTPFGALKAFNVIKAAGGATQSAVLEFEDAALVEGVVAGMNKLDVAGHKLAVQRIPASTAALLLHPTGIAPVAVTAPPTAGISPAAPAVVINSCLAEIPPGVVIRLSNMVTAEDLEDDGMYDELVEDVSDECNSHGAVKSIVIPRPDATTAAAQQLLQEDTAQLGKIFVHFEDVNGATAALTAVKGRRFNGRIVEAYYYPEELFLQQQYQLPGDYSAVSAATGGAQEENQDEPTAEEGEGAGDVSAVVPEDIDDMD